jgi:guanylate kinase
MSRKPSSVSLFMAGCVDQGEFIEHAVFAGNMYGTSKAAVEAVRSKGDYFSQYFVSGFGQNSF